MRSLSFIGIIIVLGVGAYLYMHQTKDILSGGTSNPTALVDMMGIKNDLMGIARAERNYIAAHGSFGSLDEIKSSGDLTMSRSERGPYTYSLEGSASSFRAVATFNGEQTGGMPKTISINQDMAFSQE